VDIIPEAYDATVRDRPGLFDAYYVEDFTKIDEVKRELTFSKYLDVYHIERWQAQAVD